MRVVTTKGNTIILADVTSDDAWVLEWCGLSQVNNKEIYEDINDDIPIETYESWKKGE